MADGRTVMAGAAKEVCFEGAEAQKAHAEMEAQRAMLGKPYLVQCLAVFDHAGADGRRYLTIVTK